MTTSDAPYAVVVPNLGRARPLTVRGFDELLAFVEQMARDHARFVEENCRDWEPESAGVQDVGFSFTLSRARGGTVLVGVSDCGWKIHRMEPKPIRTVSGNQSGEDVVAILAPEWTEYEIRELLSRQAALDILASWLENGHEALD